MTLLDNEFSNNAAFQPVGDREQMVVFISDGDPTVGDRANVCGGFDTQCSADYAISASQAFHANHPDVTVFSIGFDLDSLPG
jgi:hypothetical protein